MNQYFFKSLFLAYLSTSIFYSCSPSKSENEPSEKRQYVQQQNPVDTLILENTVFSKEIVSNGKLKALKKSELKFRVGGTLQQLPVQNGLQLSAGQTIAVLDQFEFRQQLAKAETELKKARLEFQDVLIGQGYYNADSAELPRKVYELAALRSGYFSALRNHKTAEFNLQETILKAPFSGKIANLKYRQYEQVSPGEVFCTLIDDTEFEVEFHLVESEIREIKLKDEVKVIPFSGDSVYLGHVSEINPVIDEHGLVMVKARVKNPGPLMEGMNVKVLVENEVPNQMVVPKSAVVLRQNQEVLFKYVDGKAFWTYVQTGLENSTSYTVKAHPDKGGSLSPGDTVIISGNLNLAHESEVVIR